MANITNRQIISDIVGDLRALNLDDRVSKKYILSKLRSYASLLIKRDADTRRLFRISEIWTNVPCVELCEVPIVECCDIDIPNCQTVMKSRRPLPELLETQNKELLQIFNPKYSREFKLITPQEYKNIIDREYQDPRLKYFWLDDGYIVVPDAMVTDVRIRGVFVSPADAQKLNNCVPSDQEACVSILDQPFTCPDYLVAPVKQETIKDLFGFFKRNVVDEEPDLNTNIKKNEKQ